MWGHLPVVLASEARAGRGQALPWLGLLLTQHPTRVNHLPVTLPSSLPFAVCCSVVRLVD